MNKLTIALVAFGVAGLSKANPSLYQSLDELFRGGSHLRKWRHVDITFPFACQRSNIGKVILYSMVPPTTSTQTNPTINVQFLLKGQKPVPDDSIEQLTVQADTSEGKQPMDFRQWLKTPTNSVLADGFTGIVHYSMDLSYQSAPTEFGQDSGQGFIGPTSWADYKTPSFQTFLTNNGLAPENMGSNPGLDSVARLMKVIGTISYSEGSAKASVTAAKSVGDCGSKTSVMEAGLRSWGVPCRSDVGWLIRETGKMERHVKPEFLYNGWWINCEPTGYQNNVDIRSFFGCDGNWSPHHFTQHFGFDIKAEFRDKEKNIHLMGPVMTLQHPAFYATDQQGKQIVIRCGEPSISFSAPN